MKINKIDQEEHKVQDKERRQFLKKSIYAAYTTPVIMSLLVEKANAGGSSGGGGSNDCTYPDGTIGPC